MFVETGFGQPAPGHTLVFKGKEPFNCGEHLLKHAIPKNSPTNNCVMKNDYEPQITDNISLLASKHTV